jgi:hypothetical protein
VGAGLTEVSEGRARTFLHPTAAAQQAVIPQPINHLHIISDAVHISDFHSKYFFSYPYVLTEPTLSKGTPRAESPGAERRAAAIASS